MMGRCAIGSDAGLFRCRHVHQEIVVLCVRRHLRFNLSYRNAHIAELSDYCVPSFYKGLLSRLFSKHRAQRSATRLFSSPSERPAMCASI
jgi:hypothetical protein